jgi:uncharacterized protein YijF (DUF1287 family)
MDLGEFLKHQHLMQTGDLIGMSSQGTIQSIIRHRTKSDLSHISIVIAWEDAGNQPFIIHSSKHKGGVHLMPLHRVLQHLDGIAAWYPLKHEKATKINPNYKRHIVAAAASQLGLDYDMSPLYRNLAGPLLRCLFPLALDAWCCSFVAAHALKGGGLAPRVDLNQQQVVDLPIVQDRVPLTPNGQWYSIY